MATRNITITSKNQITIPADMVRNLTLNRQRHLSIRRRGNELILKPQPFLEEHLSNVWEQLPTFRGTRSDSELKRTTKEAWGNRSI